MIHYLPEVLDYFKSYPSKRLLIDENALLTNKVPEMSFADFEDPTNLLSLGEDGKGGLTQGMVGLGLAQA